MSNVQLDTIDCEYLLPGTTAAYLRVANGQAAFIECNTAHAVPLLLAALERRGLAPSAVEAVVVTHAHLDHAGGAGALLRACPNAVLYAHPRAARHLVDPARLLASAMAVYGEARFRELYGTIEPVPAARVRTLDDGATFDLGASRLTAMHTRGHANHHFCVLDPDANAIYTGDAFGLAYPALQRAGLFIFPSTSPTDFDPQAARDAVARIRDAGLARAMLTHMGAVTALAPAADQLIEDLDVSEALLERATRSGDDAAALEVWLREALESHIVRRAERVGLALSSNDRALLELDLALNTQGIAFVAQRRAAAGPT